jgi:hypothetical protein
MALPFSFNNWWPIFNGPSTGRLMLELFGEPEDASTRNVLNFTVQEVSPIPGAKLVAPRWKHVLGIWFGTIGIERKLANGEKMYSIKGALFSIDDQPIVRGVCPDVEIRSYSQAVRDKGVASLKVVDSVGYDPFELTRPLVDENILRTEAERIEAKRDEFHSSGH